MGKASSSKKLAKAARAGASTSPGQRRALGFPAVLVLIVLLGASLVVYARGNRSEALPPSIGDHWHAAYGIWNCDSWEPPLMGTEDPDGIHSHQDGVIHIHPFNSSVSGRDARMGVFFEALGVQASDGEIVLPDGAELVDGAECDGEPAELVVARWAADRYEGAPEIIRSDFDDVRFLEDREAFTIALVPEGEDIPVPETLETADQASAAPTEPEPTEGDDSLDDLLGEDEDGTGDGDTDPGDTDPGDTGDTGDTGDNGGGDTGDTDD